MHKVVGVSVALIGLIVVLLSWIWPSLGLAPLATGSPPFYLTFQFVVGVVFLVVGLGLYAIPSDFEQGHGGRR